MLFKRCLPLLHLHIFGHKVFCHVCGFQHIILLSPLLFDDRGGLENCAVT